MELVNFWKCISILLKNYHAVNKKIFACKIKTIHKILNDIAIINVDNREIYEKSIQDILNGSSKIQACQSSEEDILETLASCDMDKCEGYVVTLKLLTKNDEDSVEARGVLDFVNSQYTCTFSSTVFDDFRIALISEELVVTALTNRRLEAEANRWVDFVLKPKLLKWSNSEERKENAFDSLHLIDVEKYNELYKQLKTKYSKDLIDIWEESTDPLKFVYEDLAIAAYLISLWKEHHCEPEAFADLGCGNGLLVYILNREGYKGYGYDVRSRKIWSLFPKTTLLFEETIQPDHFELPPDTDWIIGNHSDELSPWIPVLSALPAYKVKYFLLPCCPFEFSGMKFQRRNSKLSAYNDFLNYVEDISKKCGFVTLRDRLKIPSTKRIAIIGITRTYVELNFQQICSSIREFVSTEMQEHTMKLREREEVVRNCTQIESSVLDNLVLKIFLYLLNSEEEVKIPQTNWNEGCKRSIKEIAQYLSKEDLKSIKSECGGLKTLLKNKHEVFEFTTGDGIQIRRPKPRETIINGKQLTTKKRCCFFAANHPSGCPLSDSDCTFIHK
ncbi:probable tRNA (uracil-O(2)-)-methyltransferase [Episyrphus balteatus]|uniref:probable tRNA (uracil-O(2)-)-methyltransferase n=1 Tax=Episyrphus balteatus TaxID=286459 RepID=UPI002484EECF|nr:probable tRNA (uracil-O(2)-)-methyltransferase [Episyrphus balteatus]